MIRDNRQPINKRQFVYEYPMPAIVTDIVIFDLNRKRAKRKNEPWKDMWAFPGGFMDINELAIDAAKRELKEETGLTDIGLKFVRVFDDKVDRDPRGRIVSMVYVGQCNRYATHIKAGDDAGEAKWFYLDEVPDLACDHNRILTQAMLKAVEYKQYGSVVER